MIVQIPGVHFGYQNRIRKGVLNGISTLTALKSLLEASWDALGRLLGPPKVVLNGSWPLQEGFQERFPHSGSPKVSPKGGPEGPKSSPRGDWSSKRDFFKNHCFFDGF